MHKHQAAPHLELSKRLVRLPRRRLKSRVLLFLSCLTNSNLAANSLARSLTWLKVPDYKASLESRIKHDARR